MSNFAKVSWNSEEGRYELTIGGVLKAYENGTTDAEHEVGSKQLYNVARAKGYDVTLIRKMEEL